jgi:hypothetical protein
MKNESGQIRQCTMQNETSDLEVKQYKSYGQIQESQRAQDLTHHKDTFRSLQD